MSPLSDGFGALVGGRDLRAFFLGVLDVLGDYLVWAGYLTGCTGVLPDVFAFRTFRTCGRVSREERIHGRITKRSERSERPIKIF